MSGTMVLMTSGTLGRDDDVLGRRLMIKFFHQLCGISERPSVVGFYNGGVTLLGTASPVLDALKTLDTLGVDLIACGTCVEHFGLLDDIAIGRITDMREIVATMMSARRVVTV